MRKKRGFMIVFGLLVMVLLFTLGLGFLGKQAAAYRAANQFSASVEAMECATAGLEDARVKLNKDLIFPPPGDDQQIRFSYSETLLDLDNKAIGWYTVVIDRTWRARPVEILRIEVTGFAGDPTQPPRARRQISVEVDCAPEVRSGGGPNPQLGRFMNFQDHGGL